MRPTAKRDDYDRFGVAEYWVVDPNSGAHTVASSPIDGVEPDLKPIRRICPPRLLNDF